MESQREVLTEVFQKESTMCLVFLAVRATKRFPLIVAFNRDEVYSRSTLPAHWWRDAPEVLGGRDQERGGTWAAVRRDGRLALLTFVRNHLSGTGRRSKRSRGLLVSEYLLGTASSEEYLATLRGNHEEYLPYNLIVGSLDSGLYHYSNIDEKITRLSKGVHGLSNASLNTPWPKVIRGCRAMQRYCRNGRSEVEPLFQFMRDRGRYPDIALPKTGVALEHERALSSLFVEDEDYGTRTTTILRLKRGGEMELLERTYDCETLDAAQVSFRWSVSSGM